MGDADSEPKEKKDEADGEKKIPQYPLIRMIEMPEDTKTEIIELISTLIERHIADVQKACEAIKEGTDKQYGAHWHVIIGESYGFNVSYLNNHLLYMFIMGNLGVLVWKCC